MIAEDRFILDVLFAPHNAISDDLNRLFKMDHRQYPLLNWSYIIQQLKAEGVAAIFYYYIHKYAIKDLLPAEISASLKENYRIGLVKNLIATGEAKRIFRIFQETDIPLIVLKGLFLIEHIYPHPATRGLSDIDILVRKDDIFKADACLRSSGYMPKDSTPERAINNPLGYLASLDYIHTKDTLPHFHVHWHLVNTSVPAYMFASKIDMEHIWEKAIKVNIADVDMATLCPEHTMLYLCEHALRVGHSFDRLVLICDILLFMRSNTERIDWSVVWEEGCRLHLERFLFLALAVVEIFTNTPMPRIVRDLFVRKYSLRWGERIFIGIHRKKRRFRGSSYFIYLSMNRNPLSFIRFIFRTLFPPPAILCQRRYIQGNVSITRNIASYWERLIEIVRHLRPGMGGAFTDNKS